MGRVGENKLYISLPNLYDNVCLTINIFVSGSRIFEIECLTKRDAVRWDDRNVTNIKSVLF